MVKKTTTASKKRTTASKAKPVSAKKTATKKVAKKTVKRAPAKVDIYPNRMTVAVSALAGTLLVLVTIIAVLGSR